MRLSSIINVMFDRAFPSITVRRAVTIPNKHTKPTPENPHKAADAPMLMGKRGTRRKQLRGKTEQKDYVLDRTPRLLRLTSFFLSVVLLRLNAGKKYPFDFDYWLLFFSANIAKAGSGSDTNTRCRKRSSGRMGRRGKLWRDDPPQATTP